MTDWQELFIEGSERVIRAFVLGFAAGRGESEGVVFGTDVELQPEAFGDRLKALFARGSHHVVFAPARLAASLVDAVGAHAKGLGIRLERRRVVESAEFPFRIEAYSREEAATLRASLIERLPAGAHGEDLSQQEETHPEARGPEPFAPLHEYTYRASGRIAGEFGIVVDLWKRFRGQDFTEIGCISVRGNRIE